MGRAFRCIVPQATHNGYSILRDNDDNHGQEEEEFHGSSSDNGDNNSLATAGDDTIVAIVTGSSAGSVSILRISGSDAVSIARKIFRPARDVNSSKKKKKKQKQEEWFPHSHRIH